MSQPTRELAEWQFMFLSTLMSEEPVSVKGLADMAEVSQNVVIRLRSGKFVKRSTIVKVVGAVKKLPKIGGVVNRLENDLIKKKGDQKTDLTRDKITEELSK